MVASPMYRERCHGIAIAIKRKFRLFDDQHREFPIALRPESRVLVGAGSLVVLVEFD